MESLDEAISRRIKERDLGEEETVALLAMKAELALYVEWRLRQDLLAQVDSAIASGERVQRRRRSGQGGLFE